MTPWNDEDGHDVVGDDSSGSDEFTVAFHHKDMPLRLAFQNALGSVVVFEEAHGAVWVDTPVTGVDRDPDEAVDGLEVSRPKVPQLRLQ